MKIHKTKMGECNLYANFFLRFSFGSLYHWPTTQIVQWEPKENAKRASTFHFFFPGGDNIEIPYSKTTYALQNGAVRICVLKFTVRGVPL